MTTTTTTTTLGDLITTLYDEFLVIYGDEELASVAVAATINDLLTEDTTMALGEFASDEAAA